VRALAVRCALDVLRHGPRASRRGSLPWKAMNCVAAEKIEHRARDRRRAAENPEIEAGSLSDPADAAEPGLELSGARLPTVEAPGAAAQAAANVEVADFDRVHAARLRSS